MTLHFPDEVDTNVLTIDATDPKSGTAEFKATRDPRREAAGWRTRSGRGAGVAGTGDACHGRDLDRGNGDGQPARDARGLRRCSLRRRRPSAGGRHVLDGRRRRTGRAPTAVGGRAARATGRDRRHLLLPALHAVQARVGWISQGALGYVCAAARTCRRRRRTGSRASTRSSSMKPRPAAWCTSATTSPARPRARTRSSRRSSDGRARRRRRRRLTTWLRSPCLGLCEQAPAAMLRVAGERPSEHAIGARDRGARRRALDGATRDQRPRPPVLPQAGDPELRLLRRVGVVDPAEPRRLPRARRLRRRCGARSSSGRRGVIREVTESKLVGPRRRRVPDGPQVGGRRAAARAPALPGLQRRRVRAGDVQGPGADGGRSVRADRGDDDRRLRDGRRARASSTSAASIRSRAERLEHAIDAARAHGLLGDDVMGRGVRFDVEIRRGAGAYICGEETALFNSIEGFRGEPRNKPPFPVERRACSASRPCVNNVETLVNVLDVVLRTGGAALRRDRHGASRPAPSSSASRATSTRPGVYEVPFGDDARRAARPAPAASPGGRDAAGGAARRRGRRVRRPGRAGAPAHVRGHARIGRDARLRRGDRCSTTRSISRRCCSRIAAFFRDESCGQCVPCRVGTVRQEELVARLASRRDRSARSRTSCALLGEIGQAMRDASICGLGQTAYERDRVGDRQARRVRASPRQPMASIGSAPRCRRTRRSTVARSTATRPCAASPRARRSSTRAGRGHRHPDALLPARRSRR